MGTVTQQSGSGDVPGLWWVYQMSGLGVRQRGREGLAGEIKGGAGLILAGGTSWQGGYRTGRTEGAPCLHAAAGNPPPHRPASWAQDRDALCGSSAAGSGGSARAPLVQGGQAVSRLPPALDGAATPLCQRCARTKGKSGGDKSCYGLSVCGSPKFTPR